MAFPGVQVLLANKDFWAKDLITQHQALASGFRQIMVQGRHQAIGVRRPRLDAFQESVEGHLGRGRIT